MARKGKKEDPKKAAPPPAKSPAKSAVKPKAAPKKAPARAKKPAPSPTAKATIAAPKATAPYDDLKPAPAPTLGNLPWGYGDNRCCAMARDPQWAFAYWEITDDGIAAAKAKLKDPDAWLSLRIYDTTHRDFTGLNAHTHWDHGVDRGTNSYYFKAGKPGATLHVDIGVLGRSGGFQPIARSGAMEMPRDAISPRGGTETSTVFRSGPAYTYRHQYVPRPAPPGGAPEAPPPQAAAVESIHPAESERYFQHLAGEGWSRSEWTESADGGRFFRWIKWTGPVTAEHLAMLPKTGGAFTRIDILFQGERKTIRTETGERVVYGPWKVVLEAVGPGGERRTIEHWMIRRRWTTEEGMVRVETPAIITRVLGGRRVVVAQAGSETRLDHETWGSEMLAQGASEWRWIGASENLAMGSSESLQLGASEWLALGASETFGLGASESHFGGASEERP